MIKELEDRKFGRPSTYASTVDLIVARGYVRIDRQALIPTWIAFSIVGLMEQHFEWLIDYDFTADMEAGLDRIAAGEADRTDWLGASTSARAREHGRQEGLKHWLRSSGRSTRARSTRSSSATASRCASASTARTSSARSTARQRASVPEDLAPDELTVAKAVELLSNQGGEDRVLGVHPETGLTVVAKAGRYGPYVTEVLPEGDKESRGLGRSSRRCRSTP